LSYPFDSIWINQREVSIHELLLGHVSAQSKYEASTLDFISAWLTGQETFILQTSGSTGPPKSVTFTRMQLHASAARTVRALGLEKGITALVCLNTKYVAGKMMLVRALEHGMKILVVDPGSNPFQQVSPGTNLDFMAVAPLQLQTLLDNLMNNNRLNLMKAILVGGAPVSLKLKNSIKTLTCPVYETYGMTETISNVAFKLLNTSKASNYFIPLPGVNVEVDDRGCLIIHDAIQPDPIITNDAVEITKNGFRWLGRADHVINSGGVKIHPEKVESDLEMVFKTLETSYNYFIGSLPDDLLGETVTLFIEGEHIHPDDVVKLREAFNQFPERLHKPRKAVLIPEFQYTQTGKINRKMAQEGSFKLIPELVTHP